jgi:hypothetical protein
MSTNPILSTYDLMAEYTAEIKKITKLLITLDPTGSFQTFLMFIFNKSGLLLISISFSVGKGRELFNYFQIKSLKFGDKVLIATENKRKTANQI